MSVYGSGFQSGGHLRRMTAQIGLHTAAAREQRTNLYAFPDIDTAGTLGSQKALMPSETENINVHFLNIDIENTGSLGGIHNIDETVSACYFTDSADVQQVSCQIGAMGGDDGFCIALDLFFKLFVADIAHGVSRQNR